MLYYGAEWLVDGSAGLAVRLGVRPLLIGLTIVSYATSSPELAVSVSAAIKDQGPLLLGNVFGSNIANVGLILGLTALIAPPRSDGSMARKELIVLALSTLTVPVLLVDGRLGRMEGLLLVFGAVAFTWQTINWSKRRPPSLDDVPNQEERSKVVLIGIAAAGLAFLIGGGEAFVRGAVGLAHALGVEERVIGLTIVAFGTSVPELAASVVAALRGHSDLAIGNVVGSNIFNLLLILGVSSVLAPVHADLSTMTLDVAFMALTALGATVLLWRPRQMTRADGTFLILSYLTFLSLLVFGTG